MSRSFRFAVEQYSDSGVQVETALNALAQIPVSLHCWQGDDVGGFESLGRPEELGGGLAVTGSYPGKARSPGELREDLTKAYGLIPGRHRLSLHAFYGEFGGRPTDRDAIEPKHFSAWVDWARSMQLGLDFNPTCFAHPLASSGFTLSHPDSSIRHFWIEHCRRARVIGAYFGKELGSACVTNVWIPDGYKDTPADRHAPRERLIDSLDHVFKRRLPEKQNLDAVEGKLFGIGAESYTVGSHELYLGYAITRRKLLCLDSGHYHPTESMADKLSSVLQFLPRILLHVSRGVRWDSDHVVTLGDDLLAIAREVVVNQYLPRVHFGLDYFDASINRIAAWVLGTRNLQKALLAALLEPPAIREAELAGDHTRRLVLQEESRTLPIGAIWDEFCQRHGTPPGHDWLKDVMRYEASVLRNRH